MSVINQMLKDLEHRAPEQGQAPMPAVATQKSSTLKIVSISVVVLLSLNALGFYIWNLQEQVAKSYEQQQVLSSKPQAQQPEVSSAKLQVAENIQEQAALPQQEKQNVKAIQTETVAEQLTLPNTEPPKTPEVIKSIISKKSSKKSSKKTGEMSISRRQLTSEELVNQKLMRAEKAVNLNKLSKAEQLFEEILIIKPTDKQARKKLAALWFGRKSYQQAVNLLSQGIAIDKNDGELRLLKARIYLSQGQHEAAFNTLKPLASFEQEEYQVMLANIAQQIEQYPSAISAYKLLIKMQPYSGRWYLGLAIVYDKNSQFSLAINKYALALTKTDLSISSAKFAKQRMQALGE